MQPAGRAFDGGSAAHAESAAASAVINISMDRQVIFASDRLRAGPAEQDAGIATAHPTGGTADGQALVMTMLKRFGSPG
jgi:hypothetical protein